MFVCACARAQREEEKKPIRQTLPVLTVAHAGVFVLFFQLFQPLCLIIFIIKSGVQKCQCGSASPDIKLSLQGHTLLATSSQRGLLLPARARLVCCPPRFPACHARPVSPAVYSRGLGPQSLIPAVPCLERCPITPTPPFTLISITAPRTPCWPPGVAAMAPPQGPVLSHSLSPLFSTRLAGTVCPAVPAVCRAMI